MDGTVSGECTGSGRNGNLNLVIEMSGDQMVEVRAEGFVGDYPWSGTNQQNLSFPLEDGAMAEGEGWAFVLSITK
jgi:hypothetical protein